jgi:hypothetical protein
MENEQSVLPVTTPDRGGHLAYYPFHDNTASRGSAADLATYAPTLRRILAPANPAKISEEQVNA